MREEASIAAAVSAVVDRFGGIDVLVNNAGFGLFGPLDGATSEQVELQFRTKVFGAVALIRHVMPVMRDRGSGTIINVSWALILALASLLPDAILRSLLGAGMTRRPKNSVGRSGEGGPTTA